MQILNDVDFVMEGNFYERRPVLSRFLRISIDVTKKNRIFFAKKMELMFRANPINLFDL